MTNEIADWSEAGIGWRSGDPRFAAYLCSIHQLPFPSIHHVLRSRPKICLEDRYTSLNSQFPTSACQSLPRKGHFSLRESSECEWFAPLPTFLLGWSHYLITSLPRSDPFQRTMLMSEQALSVLQRMSLPLAIRHCRAHRRRSLRCGDVMKLQIRVDESGVISDVKFKTFGCGSAIASSSYMTERVKGLSLEEAGKIKNTEIAKELCLPPVKLHCSSAYFSVKPPTLMSC